jgi:hypothetical protein
MVNNDSCCIAKILKVIEILQKNACCSDICEEGCDRPILGPSASILCYNTRPINLYTRAGDLFTATYTTPDGTTATSTTFRVERVNDCCCKLRILAVDGTTTTATNSFITVNLRCMCAVSCLADLALENIC